MNDDSPVLDTAPAASHFHAVRFYDSDESLHRIVADFLRRGFAKRQPALVVATPEHSRGIADHLRVRRVDVERLRAAGELTVLDARAMTATFMVEGVLDSDRFMETAQGALDRASGGGTDRTVRLYAEMVDLLWKDGRDRVALQVEEQWNRLARTRGLSMLCGYARGSLYTDACVTEICRGHTHVVSADGTAVAADGDSLVVRGLVGGRDRRRPPGARR